MNDKIGRNDPCPCGSGKKYKSCCMNKPSTAERMKQHKVKAQWLNKPDMPNLMERTFGDSIISTGKTFHATKPKDKDHSPEGGQAGSTNQ
jgi:Predicted metal-binding protein related to the C-terminal domain of SecA